MQYRVTIHYLTPSGRESSYTDTVYGNPWEAIQDTVAQMRLDPRRKVARVTGNTCEAVT